MIGAIIQARTGSTRLRGKVLMDLNGKPVLQRVIERVQQVSGIDKIIVATTNLEEDRPIIHLAAELEVDYYSGHPTDVLNRYYKAARHHELDGVVRITADCPLLDPSVSSSVVSAFINSPFRYDYVSNVHPPTFPDGLDTECFTFKALERAAFSAISDPDREHVTPYIWRINSGFTKHNIWNDQDMSAHRWTLDTPADLTFIRAVYTYFGDRPFDMTNILLLPFEHTLTREIRL